jgi:hypothetical protein
MLASLAGAVQATERVTLPVRDGDNVSMMLAMSGVNQGVLMELISSREIAARLEAVREGNTLELELDAGKLIALWLYGADSRAFRARLRANGSWWPGDTELSESALLASRVRQREAQGLRARPELVQEHRALGLSRAVIAAEVQTHPKVQTARQTRVTRTRIAPDQKAQRPRAVPTQPAKPSPPVRPERVLEQTREQTVAAPSPPETKAATKDWPASRHTPQQPMSPTTIASQREPSVAWTPPTLPTLALPTPGSPALGATTDSDSPADAVANTIPLACPSIAGTWQANYTNFDCEAEVSFTSQGSGVYTMAQVGCGDIDATVSQRGRSLSGEWEHSICDGVLTLMLDDSCDTGTGTWQANAGKALCSVKRYPVVITRGLKLQTNPRRKLKLFSGPSKEAIAAEDEAAGDP